MVFFFVIFAAQLSWISIEEKVMNVWNNMRLSKQWQNVHIFGELSL